MRRIVCVLNMTGRMPIKMYTNILIVVSLSVECLLCLFVCLLVCSWSRSRSRSRSRSSFDCGVGVARGLEPPFHWFDTNSYFLSH